MTIKSASFFFVKQFYRQSKLRRLSSRPSGCPRRESSDVLRIELRLPWKRPLILSVFFLFLEFLTWHPGRNGKNSTRITSAIPNLTCTSPNAYVDFFNCCSSCCCCCLCCCCVFRCCWLLLPLNGNSRLQPNLTESSTSASQKQFVSRRCSCCGCDCCCCCRCRCATEFFLVLAQ